jgi:hypothetical protein
MHEVISMVLLDQFLRDSALKLNSFLKKIHKFQKWVLELARRGFGFECLSG